MKQKHQKSKLSFICFKFCPIFISFFIILIAIIIGIVLNSKTNEEFLQKSFNSNSYLSNPILQSNDNIIIRYIYYIYSLIEQLCRNIILFILKQIFLLFGSLSLQDQQETYKIKGISNNIDITRNSYGIPFIKAKNLKDGIFAQGFIQAQDRFYQLEINRRLCSGTLSDIFGDKAIITDILTRTLGFRRLNEKHSKDYYEPNIPFSSYKSKINTLEYTQAFVDGINEFMHHEKFKIPLEFSVLGIKKVSNFTVDDVLCWTRLNYFGLSKGWSREISLSLFNNVIGSDLTKDFIVDYSDYFPVKYPSHSHIPHKFELNYTDNIISRENISLPKYIQDNFNVGSIEFGGSNAFAISGKHTTTGNAYLYSDPHLPPIHPSTWYKWVLAIEDDNDNIKQSFSGVGPTLVPFHAITRTHHYSTGVTLANVDVDDTYIVRFKESNGILLYEYKGEFIKPDIITETIPIKNKPDETINIIYTKYGVVISDALNLTVSENGIIPNKLNTSGPYFYKLAIKSSGLHPSMMTKDTLDNTIISFMGNAMLAESIEEFKIATTFCVMPVLNYIYADKEGNIAHFLTGRVPKRENPNDGILPAKSFNNENNWTEFFNYNEMPSQINPEKGYIVSSNHKIWDGFYPIRNTWSQGYRAKRIEDLILSKISSNSLISLQDGKNIQKDHLSTLGLEFKRIFLSLPNIESKLCSSKTDTESVLLCNAYNEFKNWDGITSTESSGTCIYETTYYVSLFEMLYNVVGEELTPYCLGQGHHPLINPATEIGYTIATSYLSMLDSYGTANSNITKNLSKASKLWLDKSGGLDNLLINSFIKANKWLSLRFYNSFTSKSLEDVSSWRWGELHHTKYVHNLGVISPLVDEILSPSIEANGDSDTVALAFVVPHKLSLHQKGWGVSYRHANDMGSNNPGDVILPPGNSGQYGSIGYSGELEIFNKGEYISTDFTLRESNWHHKLMLDNDE